MSEDGKPQPIAFFEQPAATPLDIVLAVDASASTSAEKEIERDALQTFVNNLVRPQDRVALLSFADRVTEVVPFTSNLRRIDQGFRKIKRGSATALYDAITFAAQRLQTPPTSATSNGAARRVIVLITDGENTVDHGSYPSAVEQAQRAGVIIDSLIIIPVVADAGRDTGGEHALIQMSRDTGGQSYELINNGDITRAPAHISTDLRTQYTLGYYAPHKPLDDRGLRHIHIELKNPTLRAEDTLRYRSAYYIR